MAERRRGGGVGFLRAVRQKLQEIHFASFCLPLRARRTAMAWSTIAALIIFLRLGEGYCFFLVVYCAGQGVRHVFVARPGRGREARVRVAAVSGTCIIDPPLKASCTRGSVKNDSWLVFRDNASDPEIVGRCSSRADTHTHKTQDSRRHRDQGDNLIGTFVFSFLFFIFPLPLIPHPKL